MNDINLISGNNSALTKEYQLMFCKYFRQFSTHYAVRTYSHSQPGDYKTLYLLKMDDARASWVTSKLNMKTNHRRLFNVIVYMFSVP